MHEEKAKDLETELNEWVMFLQNIHLLFFW